MNTQRGQDLLALEALEAAEPWPLVYSSLHADLHFLRRTAALTLVHRLQVWPAKAQQELVKVSMNVKH